MHSVAAPQPPAVLGGALASVYGPPPAHQHLAHVAPPPAKTSFMIADILGSSERHPTVTSPGCALQHGTSSPPSTGAILTNSSVYSGSVNGADTRTSPCSKSPSSHPSHLTHGSAPARPTPIHPAIHLTTSPLTSPALYKPTVVSPTQAEAVSMYDRGNVAAMAAAGMLGAPYLHGHTLAYHPAAPHPAALGSPLYPLSYPRAEYSLLDRHHPYKSKFL